MHTKNKHPPIPPENQRFNILRHFFGKTQEEISRIMGISRSGVASIASGRAKLTERSVRILQNEFYINPRWLRYGDEPMILPERIPGIPVFNNIPSGPWIEWLYTDRTNGIENYLQVPDVIGENLFAIRIKDNSMEPSLSLGDILIIDPHKKFRRGLVVVSHTWGCKIRNVTRVEKNRFFLVPMNNAYDSEEVTVEEGTWFYVPIKVISIKNL